MSERLKAELLPQSKQMLRLMTSPQMQKALLFLQLPVMELQAAVCAEVEENPLLEYSEEERKNEKLELLTSVDEKYYGKKRGEESDLQSFIENTLAIEESLFEKLMQQAREKFCSKEKLQIAQLLIGNFNEHGFLETSLDEIAFLEEIEKESLEEILEEIKQFDPPGVGAKDIKESLLLQLKRQGKERSLAYKIVESSFDMMLKNLLPLLSKKSGYSIDKIQEVIDQEIATLELHPGHSFSRGHYPDLPQIVVPDVIVTSRGSSIEINERSVPPIRFNPHYLNLLASDSLPHETKEYIEEKIISGKRLMRNLCERQKTLYKIALLLIERQAEFFCQPKGNLVSLTMKEIAESLDLHESTIARAVAGKYLSCERGIFSLRSFFTHSYVTESGDELSAPAVKELLQKIIQEEDCASPHSDQELSRLMLIQGLPCARRTVAKYRHELGIGSKSERKQYPY